MISKTSRQHIMNLIEKYGDMREHYGRNSIHWLDFEKTDENRKIGRIFAEIETFLTCCD